MAHVHGAKVIETAAKASAPTLMGGTGAMGGMMQHGSGGMGAVIGKPVITMGLATGSAITATTHTGRSFMVKLSKHPLILFGAGVVAGYLIHKYRKEIIESANRAAEKSKDFVLQQRENLEDLVSASKEAADDAGQS